MYFLCRVLLVFYLTCAGKDTVDAYLAPVCSANGGVCSKNIVSYAPGLHIEKLVNMKHISEHVAQLSLLLRPPRKACAYILSTVLDVIRDVLNLEVLMDSHPPPPPTALEHILRLVGWRTIDERQLLIDVNPGLMVYFIIISFTIWMFVWSFYSKTNKEWSLENGFIFDSSLRQNLPYPLLCTECLSKKRKKKII